MREARRIRVTLTALLAVALILIVVSYADGSNSALRHVRSAAASVFGGAERAASSAGRLFRQPGSDSQVTAMQKQVLRLRAELSQAQVSKADYAQLHSMLLLAGAAQARVMAATVIATGQSFQQTVTLDAGSRDGVKVGQTVLNGQGLVGKITAVTTSTSTVQLADAPAVVIGVAVAPSGQLGWVTGPGPAAGGPGVMHLQMLSSAATLKTGEQLVTGPSPGEQSFVAGVPVGVITKLVSKNGALTEAADVRPYVTYSALSVVGIVMTPPAQNPGFAAVPPLPHPGPTVTVTVTARPAPAPGSVPTPTTSP